MEFKSQIKNKRPIDWKHTIEIEELRIDPKMLEMHRERVNQVFANETEEKKAQQIHNIVIRENAFNLAMDYLVSFYDVDVHADDVEELEPKIKQVYGDQIKDDQVEQVLKKIIYRGLIFKDLQKELSISVNDEELDSILDNYYEQSNQSIRNFKENKAQYEAARETLLDEKTVAEIIGKFTIDTSKYEKNLRDSLAEKMELDKQIEDMKKEDKTAEEK
ncbi:hypothetical protein OF376_01655 [Ureaplasma miroungigenitalium]|uniref:Trigger factor n=1 Tax=Ureaplasma miroungigenitalium TaxID=1042321 RepID=A0ABT3BMI9_9BACT|nr:hypothetical protein [Ureaplasma miroungigenitalium]MCV3728470.1 hypothetical protein [Ureaplasma miroungigenitalium]MCV3734257.1 hypothetical protein [Ureaplasma miroungigenitalium]